ncbi:MAG TPA: class I SAM-dependent methyltransferase [Candidatus Acidoferrales bacterium]|nr:class I SAM-dependent methyltransferase [Candidatus Acidoferrales bacterium]
MADTAPASINRERFAEMYGGQAPWDTGNPQPVFVKAADKISGSILDIGCGPGDNALFFASRGHAVTGADFLEEPVARAKQKASERGLSAKFVEKDALQLQDWSERFDNIIDSGLFHVFSGQHGFADEDRVRYAEGLKTVLKPGGRLFLLCFSDQMPGTQGPRRVSQSELRATFSNGWEIESIEPAEFDVRPEAKAGLFQGINPKAWFMIARRTA